MFNVNIYLFSVLFFFFLIFIEHKININKFKLKNSVHEVNAK